MLQQELDFRTDAQRYQKLVRKLVELVGDNPAVIGANIERQVIQILVENGEYIQAIKLYRMRHNVGLADAKTIIDKVRAQVSK